jgi:methyl-accepting chemotaxis protein
VAKEIETGIRMVSRLSLNITNATNEHSLAVTSLVTDADEVRRIAKQTARAVGEQAEALAGLAAGASKQTMAFQGFVLTTAEQATTTAQVTQSMRVIRGRAREITTALADQAASAAIGVTDIATVAREVASLRASTAEQVDLLTGVAMTGTPGEPSAVVDPVP